MVLVYIYIHTQVPHAALVGGNSISIVIISIIFSICIRISSSIRIRISLRISIGVYVRERHIYKIYMVTSGIQYLCTYIVYI